MSYFEDILAFFRADASEIEQGQLDRAIDLGSGHALIPRSIDGLLFGFDEWHINPATDRPCGGWVPVNRDRETRHWDLVQADPVTLHPSLLCGTCPSHGWVREGRWIQA